MTVAPQFATLARTSTDPDVLFWCACSSSNAKTVENNLVVLSRLFPNDAHVLAWRCGSPLRTLNMNTRHPGPLSISNWSVVLNVSNGTPIFMPNRQLLSQWEQLATSARRGQKLEPDNAFWWWLEATALLGARRDSQVWSVVRVGSTKQFFNDHNIDALLALRRAHLKTVGSVPVTAYLSSFGTYSLSYWPWSQATRQFCENVLGARMANQNKKALEGARDMLFLSRLLRLSHKDPENALYSGISNETSVLQCAQIPSVTKFRLSSITTTQGFANYPRSLLRYANEQHRPNLARQIANEWKIVASVRSIAITTAKTTPLLTSFFGSKGISDSVISLSSGAQNTGTLLVQTLPIPLLLLGALSLAPLVFCRRPVLSPLPVPSWKRGLGWSAFALVALFCAQTLFNYLAWSTVTAWGVPAPWGFNFMLPRLVELLPIWAFAFVACVLAVGALWTTILSARRARGDATIGQRLRLLFADPNDRVGVVNLEPLLQIIGIVSLWGIGIIALGLWFFLPQQGVNQNQDVATMHSSGAGLMLIAFCALSSFPTVFLRTRQTGFRAYFLAWTQTMQRFIVAAHIALVTTLYFLLAIMGAFYSAQFDAQWLRIHTPITSAFPKP